MSAERARLRQRLGFIVTAIDGGRYREPEQAADAILDVVLSILPEHRSDLVALLRQTTAAEAPR